MIVVIKIATIEYLIKLKLTIPKKLAPTVKPSMNKINIQILITNL